MGQSIKERNELKECAEVGLSNVQRLVMPDSVVGYVSYGVRVTCPHCSKHLQLNEYPYDDDRTEYSLAEDDLGMALFGSTSEPAKWDRLKIEYKCCGCENKFSVSTLIT